ncbi:MAG: hypothetical protein AMXMBFR7_26540 [Planctomycetota bacterium]
MPRTAMTEAETRLERARLKREVIRALDEARGTVCKRAATPESQMLSGDPDPEALKRAYARFDCFVDYLMGQEVF